MATHSREVADPKSCAVLGPEDQESRSAASQKGLYIQMFSIHGLVRSENMELGRDADTGGQVQYVIELGRALSQNPLVRRVELLTRMIQDKTCSRDYSRAVETVNDRFSIVRIPCGGKQYLRKETLWPHLDRFVENTKKYIQDQGQTPDLVHGHYADAGFVAKALARAFDIPFVFTGHSLGRAKKERLLAQGADPDQLNRQLRIDHRIEIEEQVCKAADLVVASTRQEASVQYGAYENKPRKIQVISPGIDVSRFAPFYREKRENGLQTEAAMLARATLTEELNRFFQEPEKPMILMLCRPDKRKNISGLIKAFGKSPDLQAMANIAVFAGIRKDIADKEEGARKVLTRMLLLMDKYNLYGKMAIPKKHDFDNEVPELYRIAAERQGVFVNPALTEPFGLTLLEASATGLPVVATRDGGPRDILENCKSGLLVDPSDTRAIADAIKAVIVDSDQWKTFCKNGIFNTRRYYTWEHHAQTYTDAVAALAGRVSDETAGRVSMVPAGAESSPGSIQAPESSVDPARVMPFLARGQDAGKSPGRFC
jgi:sucrose-phosphate synthase